MRITNFVTALALLSPGLALAQVGKPAQPVALEIVASGGVDATATKLTMTISFTEEAKTQDAADKARTAKMAKVGAALKAQGLTSAALSDLSASEQTKIMLASGKGSGDDDSEDADAKDPKFSATEAKKLTVTSAAQAEAVKAALEKLDVTVSDPSADLDEAGFAAAERQAKAKALRTARADADAYAKEMGLRVNRVVRISEVGNNLLLPGVQAKIEDAISKGPAAMAAMFKNPEGAVHVEKAIIVEFELTQ